MTRPFQESQKKQCFVFCMQGVRSTCTISALHFDNSCYEPLQDMVGFDIFVAQRYRGGLQEKRSVCHPDGGAPSFDPAFGSRLVYLFNIQHNSLSDILSFSYYLCQLCLGLHRSWAAWRL